MDDYFEFEAEIESYYGKGTEQGRLSTSGPGKLEYLRTRDLLDRFLPPPPTTVLDVGGGAGIYALPLAKEGYKVHLIDPARLHVDQAAAASDAQPDAPLASAKVGDARRLDRDGESVDAVLLLGPLYHLTARDERVLALREAYRVLRRGGVVAAAGISRFASLIDGLFRGFLEDEEFEKIAERDIESGQHRNPDGRPGWFTTAYFHLPHELRDEAIEAGFVVETLAGIEGIASTLPDLETRLAEPARRERLMSAVRRVETEPSLLGGSSHLLVVGRRT